MRRPPRKLNLLDAMILVAATAAGIVATRHVWGFWSYRWFWGLDEGWGAWAILQRILTVAALGLPALTSWTAAVLALRLRRPRPLLRRLPLQPGAVACAAALLVIAIEAIGELISAAYFDFSKGYSFGSSWKFGLVPLIYTRVLMRMPYPVSVAVLTAWATLGLSRRCRPERSGIDRAGRALGTCWIILAFLFWINQNFLNLSFPGALSR